MYDPQRFKEYFDHAFTYEAGFRRNVRRYGSAAAMIDPDTGESWTYSQLDAEVARAASALSQAGVGRGDSVVYQLANGPEFAILYLATQRLAAVSVPINYRLSPGETAHILDDSDPKVFVHSSTFHRDSMEAVRLSSCDPVRWIVGGESDQAATPFWDALKAAPNRRIEVPEDFSTYEESTRLYTSGTTGMPKGVPLPSLVEVMSAHDVIMHFPLSPQDRTLNTTPWFHRGGLYSGGPNPVFYSGGSVVPMRVFDADRALDLTEELGITFLIGAPVTLGMLANAQERKPRDLSTLRGIVTMGAPLSRADAIRYQEILTPRIFNGYGTTETFWNTFLRPEDLPDHAGTTGRASTDDDVAVVKIFEDRVATPEETVAPDNSEIGEVIMRSPKSGFSYFNAPNRDEEKFHYGWLYPGDLATWDSEGFVTVVGRKDDMIISGGENIHPVQIEEALETHPGVQTAVVVGVPDSHWGQRVVAYVIPTGEGATPEDLDALCREEQSLANFKRPRAYRMVDELPLTPTGKKMHYKVAEIAEEDDKAGKLVAPGS
ncbi:class I adenylate-forming enzyme family protein [Curtobacterium sp. S6]|uniref:class I adenylate-forming enzyme family protein n=1 Tax=Curtobacterium sp. S6 TaxID=1479623 RepID=UPI000A3E19E8|nr:AMP-binding protein [Curtobacterium sp. S6]